MSMPEHLVFLSPEDISEPEDSNVRPWSAKQTETEKELDELEALGRSMASEGQLQPIRVAKGPDGAWLLIAGRRRKRAAQMWNLQQNWNEPLTLACVVEEGKDGEVSPAKMFRQASHENTLRRQISPMDFAMNIATVRENFKWKGGKGTEKAAKFFEVSPATISQYEKLLELEPATQSKVHTGELSRDSAFALVKIGEKKGKEAAKEVEAKAEAAAEEVKVEAIKKATVNTKPEKVEKKAKSAKAKVIKEAEREVSDKPKPRSKSEIMEFFTSCYGPMYGHPNGAVHQFVGALEKYAGGELSAATLYKYFDRMVEKAAKGTKEKEEEKIPAKKVPAKAPAKKAKGSKKTAAKK